MKNKAGFSLVEVMVAMGLMGLASIGFLTFTENVQKGQNKVKDNAEVLRAMSALNLAVSSPLCADAIKGPNDTPVRLSMPISFVLGQNLIPPGAPLEITKLSYGGSHLFDKALPRKNGGISSIYLVSAIYEEDITIIDTSTPPVSVPYRALTGVLRVDFNKRKNSYGSLVSEELGFRFLMDSGGELKKCGKATSSESYLCSQVGGVWQPLSSPKCSFNSVPYDGAVRVSCSRTTTGVCYLTCPTGKRVVPTSELGVSPFTKVCYRTPCGGRAIPGAISSDGGVMNCNIAISHHMAGPLGCSVSCL